MKKKDDILGKKEIVVNEKSLDGTIVEQKIEKAKEEKTVPAKKLPGILKKSYTVDIPNVGRVKVDKSCE